MGTTFEKVCGSASEHLQKLQQIADDLEEGIVLLETSGRKKSANDVKLVAVMIRLINEARMTVAKLNYEDLPVIEQEEANVANAIRIACSETTKRIRNAQNDLEKHGNMPKVRKASPKNSIFVS